MPQTAALSEATLLALQLDRQPFGQHAPDAVSFSDETSAEQLADVKQALITGDDLLLILGEAGSGKTALLNQLGTHSGLRIQCFAVKGSPRFSTLNLFAGMLEAFKRKPPEKLKEILDDLIPCLQTMVARNTLSAIVLDDADQVTESELTQLLSSMLYVNSQDETLMRVALAAPPEFEDRIPDLLPAGADLPYSSLTIEGMSPSRAADFLACRLEEAGYTGELPFTERDLAEFVDQSGGLPGALQVAAADALNRQYGPTDSAVPAELLSAKGESFLQTRIGKIGLGILASLLILGGISLFLPDTNDNDGRYVSASNTTSQSPETVSTLRRLEDGNLVPQAEPAEPAGLSGAEPDRTAPTPTNAATSAATGAATDSTTSAPAGSTPESRSEAPGEAPGESPGPGEAPEQPPGGATGTTGVDTRAGNGARAVPQRSNESAENSPGTSAAATTSPAGQAGSDNRAGAVTEQASGSAQASGESGGAEEGAAEEEVQASSATQPADRAAPGAAPGTAPGPDGQQLTDQGASAEPSSAASAASAESAESAESAASAASAPELAPDVDPELAEILESPTWILVQDPTQVTVQMSASRDRESVENFLKRNREVLPPPNSIYTFERDGDTWYALLHGLFPSFNAANAEVQQMPASALTNQPWIRNVGRIQAALKAQ